MKARCQELSTLMRVSSTGIVKHLDDSFLQENPTHLQSLLHLSLHSTIFMGPSPSQYCWFKKWSTHSIPRSFHHCKEAAWEVNFSYSIPATPSASGQHHTGHPRTTQRAHISSPAYTRSNAHPLRRERKSPPTHPNPRCRCMSIVQISRFPSDQQKQGQLAIVFGSSHGPPLPRK